MCYNNIKLIGGGLMAKGRLVLSVDDELVKKIKIVAIQDDTNVTAIVEKLIEEYLKSKEGK